MSIVNYIFFYCIDFFHSLSNSLIIILRAQLLMKEILLPQNVMVGSHTLSLFIFLLINPRQLRPLSENVLLLYIHIACRSHNTLSTDGSKYYHCFFLTREMSLNIIILVLLV